MFGNAPKPLWEKWIAPDERNRIPLACRAMLIREPEGRKLLFETGIGAFFPPELREARQEFQWAAAGRLPELVELDDMRGDLHMHSTWTDGLATIDEMAQAAKQRGLKYIAITDHSKRVAMVGGLDGKALRRQWAEIDKLNERLSGIQVLKGVEVDILEAGGLDLADDVLA